jgi:hypothetical protein
VVVPSMNAGPCPRKTVRFMPCEAVAPNVTVPAISTKVPSLKTPEPEICTYGLPAMKISSLRKRTSRVVPLTRIVSSTAFGVVLTRTAALIPPVKGPTVALMLPENVPATPMSVTTNAPWPWSRPIAGAEVPLPAPVLGVSDAVTPVAAIRVTAT